MMASLHKNTTHFDMLLEEANLMNSTLNRYIRTFTICPKSVLYTAKVVHLQDEINFFNHPYLTNCYYRNLSYCACVTYADGRHECNSFPVILGSNMDLQFIHMANNTHNSEKYCDCVQTDYQQYYPDIDYTKNLFTNTESFDLRYYSNLYGYILVAGRATNIPNIMKNNSELYHIISEKTVMDRSKIKKNRYANSKISKVFKEIYQRKRTIAKKRAILSDKNIFTKNKKSIIKYLYTDDNRGILLKYSSNELLFRDFFGKNYLNEFPQEHVQQFDEMFNYNVHLDWNTDTFKQTARMLKKNILPIDNLSNKLILSPAILLWRLYFLIHKKPMLAKQIVHLGLWSKLLSFTAQNLVHKDRPQQNHQQQQFHDKLKLQSCGGVAPPQQSDEKNLSNLYRNVTSSQIGKRECFNCVIRPSPHNISTNIIPERYNGFLCLLERGINIDSFNKNYLLPNDVICPTFNYQKKQKYLMLNECLSFLVENRLLVLRDNTDGTVVILINGGLPTKYTLNPGVHYFELFEAVKLKNPFIEFCYFNDGKYIMLNHFMGTPFKMTCCGKNGKNYYLSPLELHDSHLSDQFSINTFFGNSSIAAVANNIENFKLNKLLFGVNYMKNQIQNTSLAPYSIFTRENTMFFHDKPVDNNGGGGGSLQFTNVFMVEPFCTQDGYILNMPGINVLFIRRYKVDLIYHSNMKVILNTSLPLPNCNKTHAHLYIGEIQTFNYNLEMFDDTLKVLKNPKINIQTLKTGNNCFRHQLFVEFDDKCIRDGEHFFYTIQSYIFYDEAKKMKKLSIEVIFQHVNSTYDGLKLCNYACQKGICNNQLNIKSRHPNLPNNTQLVSSVFSILGRSPIMQLKEMQQNSAATPSKPLVGECSMAVLKNSAFDHKSVNPMRFDNLTINIIQLNDCYLATHMIQQDPLAAPLDKKTFLPPLNREKLQLFLTTGKNIEFHSHNKKYSLLNM